MKIFIANYAGFCFGVERALNFLNKAKSDESSKTYTLGPLIHNPQVTKNIEDRGIKVVENLNDINEKYATVIFRTHGVGPKIYESANKIGLKIVDATCPYVKKVQEKALELVKDGYKVIIIGDPQHPEVRGIKGWSNDNSVVVNNIGDIEALCNYDKVGVVAQTTLTEEKWDELLERITDKFVNVKTYKTICTATKQRQNAAKELTKYVDKMIVVGGLNSSNTQKLVELCKETGVTTYHIEKPEDISRYSIRKNDKIGITAGASTPDWIIKEVINKMKDFTDEIVFENEEKDSKEKKEDNTNEQDNITNEYEETFIELSSGDIVKGNVVQVNQNEIMVNVGYKSDGIIPLNELSTIPFEKPEDIVNVDDKIEVYVMEIEDKEGNLILSKKRADLQKAWEKVEEIKTNDELIEADVINEVKGGLLVNIEGVRGFVPASHVSTEYVPDLSIFKDEKLKLKIIELDKAKKQSCFITKSSNARRERKIKRTSMGKNKRRRYFRRNCTKAY